MLVMEPKVWALIAGVVSTLALYLFSLRVTPKEYAKNDDNDEEIIVKWADGLKPSWGIVNSISLVITLLTVFSVQWFWGKQELDALMYSAVTVSIAMLVYMFIQSLFTDFQVHRVSRYSLYFAMISPLVLHSIVLMRADDRMGFGLWFLLILCMTVFMFTGLIMGQSDARALMLAVIATFPIIGMPGFFNGLMIFVMSSCIYIIGYNLLQAVKATDHKSFFKQLKLNSRKHYPMVPFILLPFVIITLTFA